jgi:hypothetical protein
MNLFRKIFCSELERAKRNCVEIGMSSFTHLSPGVIGFAGRGRQMPTAAQASDQQGRWESQSGARQTVSF